MNIVFLHSAGAQGPHEGSGEFAASLQRSLVSGYNVLYPKMPHPEDPKYMPWKGRLEQVLAALDDEVILVGHSLGGSVLLKYLSEELYSGSIAGVFLVATPYWGGEGNWNIDEYILREDFPSGLSHVPRIFLYHSVDDDTVPFAHLALYAEKLPQAVVRELDGYGHIFRTGLPELANDIKSVRNSDARQEL